MTTISRVRDAVLKGVAASAASPSIEISTAAVGPVSAAVAAQVVPVIDHLTNNEVWYRSRVTWGALLAAVAGILALFGIAFPTELQGKIIDLVVAATPIVGGLIALYGRWKARKPIGR